MPDPTPHLPAVLRGSRTAALAAALAGTALVGLACTEDPGFLSFVPPSSTPPSAVGGRVWFDFGGLLEQPDGRQDPLEPGLLGAMIVLRDTDGVVGTATTQVDGTYAFPLLSAGVYQLEVTPPPGKWVETVTDAAGVPDNLDSDPNPTLVALAEGETNLSLDFGFFWPSGNTQIGDTVWMDQDADGLQDAVEVASLGLENVRVSLLDPAGNQIAEQWTGPGGIYVFQGLVDGQYALDVDDVTLPPGFVPTVCDAFGLDDAFDSDCEGEPFLLGGSGIDPTFDFGFVPPANGAIGDLVWDDLDQDGCQDLGEPGMGGIRLTATDGLGIVRTTTSLFDGSYVFAGLTEGTYTVALDPTTLPPGYGATACEACGNAAIDSECDPVTVVLGADEVDSTVDFGLAFTSPLNGSIGDRVWFDVDGDGLQGALDVGLGGVEVELHDAVGLVATIATQPDGSYEFRNLAAGVYVVQIDLTAVPLGFEPTDCAVGPDPSVDSDCLPAVVSLATSSSRVDDVDFGFRATQCSGTIGDFVWADLDADGIQDPGEPGIAGVTVTLRNSQGTDVGATITGADGSYLFVGRCAGTYTVNVNGGTVQMGFVESLCNVGPDDTVDNDCSPHFIVLETDTEQESSVDFGFAPPAQGSIAGRIWNDLNLDGCEGGTEPGLGGVLVGLRNDQGTILVTTLTSAGGDYAFTGLFPGNYSVEVDLSSLPADAVPSPCDVCPDTKDSDCSPAAVSVPTGGSGVTDVDIGYRSLDSV